MANFGLIDFKIGLYIKVNVTYLKSISTNLLKMAINWHKIGQMPLWRHGHYLVIFHPILTFFFHKCLFLKTNRIVTITKLYFL